MRPVRLAVLAGSPVYYQAPLYRRIAAHPEIDFTAIFASTAGVRPSSEGYAEPVAWDVDSLSGFDSVFLRRAARNPSGGGAFALHDLDVVGAVRRGRFDVLWMHGYHTVTHLLAAAAQRLRGGTLLIREEQTLLHARPWWKSVLKEPVLRRLLRNAGALYIGTENRRWFEHYGVPPERQFFTPYAVENERLQRAEQELAPRRDELRHAFGVDARGPVFLTVSRLIGKKQPLFLLDAFARARRRRQCALLVVGSGELEAEMRRKVRDEQIPDVVLAGFMNQTEIPRAYAVADTFLLASKEHETWGLVVNEAMNFGLPVVTSDKVGSAKDLVREGENGFVVPVDDAAALAERIVALADDGDLRARLGAASRRLIADWTYDATERGILAAVAAMTGRALRLPKAVTE